MGSNNSYSAVIETYLEAAGDASRRSRITVLIMVTACVLSLVGFWNSRQGSWIMKRIQVAQNALDWFSFPDSLKKTISEEEIAFPDSVKKEILNGLKHNRLPLGVELKLPDAIRIQLSKGINFKSDDSTRSIIDQAAFFISQRNIRSKRQLQNMLDSLETARMQKVLIIEVPFFGVSFDLNDLGMVSGLTFLAIIMMLRFCLSRELRNLKYIFEVAKNQGAIAIYYDLLAMRQVFTVPRAKEYPKSQPYELLPKFLIFLPLGVHFVVIGHDLFSIDYGRSISEGNTYFVTFMSILFFLLIMASTKACLKLWKEIDYEWEKQAKDLKII